METVVGVLVILGFIGFWVGVFRKPGRKARVVFPSLLLMFFSPLLSPQFREGMAESAKSQPAPVQSQAKPRPTLAKLKFMEQCIGLVQDSLKSPRSSRYAPTQAQPVGDEWVWVAWVDAKNPFGVELRTDFICGWSPKTNEVRVNFQPR